MVDKLSTQFKYCMNKQWFFLNLGFIAIAFLFAHKSIAQCCSAGSGCTIAGDVAQNVLQKRQLELSSNFQFVQTNSFYKKDKPAAFSDRTFDSFESRYQYFKLGYGVTESFTISLETGYYFTKKEIGLGENPLTTYSSKGFGDLLIFPKYNVLNNKTEHRHDEITLGLGYKLPLGSFNDSTGNIEPFSGQTFYVTNPTSVQLSSGAQDIVFFTQLSRRHLTSGLSVIANAYYIKKSFNPNGEKLGDYFSTGLFVSKSFFDCLGAGAQLRYEQVGQMKINENVFLFGKPSNYYPEATGYRKVFITPQVSYTIGSLSFFGSYDIPIYQYLNTSPYYTQAASDFQATIGLAYRVLIQNEFE